MLRSAFKLMTVSANRSSAAVGSNVRHYAAGSAKPARVTVTGASGQIGYSLLFRIASGAMLGPDTPVQLRLLELPNAMDALKGVEMELNDCAFPLLDSIVSTDDLSEAFDGCNVAMLVGAKPRGPGMERGDLLKDNGAIFTKQGKAINDNADRDDLKVVVVGNPANTNCWIASKSAPDVDPKCFSAMTRLDHNRALAQLSAKLGCKVDDVEKFCIWGNHSSTQYPDVSHSVVNGKKITDLVDSDWVANDFIPTVQKRGAAIIAARGLSSAASAASSAIDHIRDWTFGTNGGWQSMAIESDGSYGTTKGLFYSFPVTIDTNGNYSIVQGLDIDQFSRERMDATNQELLEEQTEVAAHLGL